MNVSNNGKSTPKHAGLVTLFSQCKVHNRNKRWGPQQIPVLGCQPAGDQSHKHSDRLPLLSARPAVTSPAAEHHRPLAGTKLYCLVTEAHVCKQLAQGCTRQHGGRDSNLLPVDRKSSSLTTRPPNHT